MEAIGEKDSLYFVVGDDCKGGLREVDIFYKDLSLTPIDKAVYVSQFCHSMRIELEELRQNKISPDGFFLNLGPTTDDCSCRISLTGLKARLTFDIDGKVTHIAYIPLSHLINTYEEVIRKLEAKHA